MSQRGFSGISFPFRFNGRGGVSTSTTSPTDFSHIEESLKQIILTSVGERRFEIEFGSEVYKQLFKVVDATNLNIIKFLISEAIAKWDDRVKVEEVRAVAVEDEDGNSLVEVEIDVLVDKYLKRKTFNITLGGV